MYVDKNKDDEVEKLIKLIKKSYHKIYVQEELFYLPAKAEDALSGKYLFSILSDYFPDCALINRAGKYCIIAVQGELYDLNGKLTNNNFFKNYKNSTKFKCLIPSFVIDYIKESIKKETKLKQYHISLK